MTTGQKIKQIRKSRHMTQLELAQKVGYTTHSAIVKIESGANDVRLPTLNKIAVALGVKLSDVLGDEETPTPKDEREEAVIKLFREMSPERQEAMITLLTSQRDSRS